MSYFVIGGTGFNGRNLDRSAAEIARVTVHVLVRKGSKKKFNDLVKGPLGPITPAGVVAIKR